MDRFETLSLKMQMTELNADEKKEYEDLMLVLWDDLVAEEEKDRRRQKRASEDRDLSFYLYRPKPRERRGLAHNEPLNIQNLHVELGAKNADIILGEYLGENETTDSPWKIIIDSKYASGGEGER